MIYYSLTKQTLSLAYKSFGDNIFFLKWSLNLWNLNFIFYHLSPLLFLIDFIEKYDIKVSKVITGAVQTRMSIIIV